MAAKSVSANGRRANPFSPKTVLGFVGVGFVAFLLLLYFMAIGDTGGGEKDGTAHAASNGLNGYSAIVELLEAEGVDVSRSRSKSDLETYDLLVLAPPTTVDPEEFGEFLTERRDQGPTMVILPKWLATKFPPLLPDEVREKLQEDWVRLLIMQRPGWTEELPEPFAFEVTGDDLAKDRKAPFTGPYVTGELPTGKHQYTDISDNRRALVTSNSNRVLAFVIEDMSEYDDTYPVYFVVDPDLMNNYGMADQTRARLAVELVQEAAYYDDTPIIFDLTMNGKGNADNLLTLAFRPPFLAATLCLIALLIVIGWRAFKRFGPPMAEGQAIAFGKQQLVTNGAGLILRARRFGLLAEPYIDLSAQRTRDLLGMSNLDMDALDAAVERKLPDEPNFTQRANALRKARSQSDILRAAQALKELERTLKP